MYMGTSTVHMKTTYSAPRRMAGLSSQRWRRDRCGHTAIALSVPSVADSAQIDSSMALPA